MKIIPSKSLKVFLQKTLKSYVQVGRALHIGFVSALHHAATTGDPQYLTILLNGLRQNDQTAMRYYIRRVHIFVGLGNKVPVDGMDAAKLVAAAAAGAIVEFKEGTFRVVRGHNTPEAKAVAKLCETKLIAPDGKAWRYLLDRNNFAEMRTLGDQEFLTKLVSLAKKADEPGENEKVAISPAIRKFLTDIRTKAEAFANGVALSTEEVPTSKPKTRRSKATATSTTPTTTPAPAIN